MHLSRIILHDFKNIADADLDLSPGLNCIVGDNGTGKTNLLDAVYYLSMTKSYFSSSDRYAVRHGCEEAGLSGFYLMDDLSQEKISARIGKGEKSIRRGAKEYERFSDHIGLIPIVMVSPSDSALINDSGEERRRYLNFILSQMDRRYLAHVQQYNRLLAVRNRLLREFRPGGELLLDTVSVQMAPHADYIHDARRRLCSDLLPVMQRFHSLIAPSSEEVSLTFSSSLDECPFEELMRAGAERDRLLGYTFAGVQRDEISFAIDGHPLRRCGSQGQQKTFLLALKLAQMSFMKDACGVRPILLLDDVFDKLDTGRVEALLGVVSDGDCGQIFLTDSNKVRVDSLLASFGREKSVFIADGGKYSKL